VPTAPITSKSFVPIEERSLNRVQLALNEEEQATRPIREAAERQITPIHARTCELIEKLKASCVHDYRFPEDPLTEEDRARRFIIRTYDDSDTFKPDFSDFPVTSRRAICLHCCDEKEITVNMCPDCLSSTAPVSPKEKIAMTDIGSALAPYCQNSWETGPGLLTCTSILICSACGFRIAILDNCVQ